MRTIVVITTGGTIEKTYDERTGELINRRSIVHRMLQELRLEDVEVEVVELMSKDSLNMDEADRTRVVEAVRAVEARHADDADPHELAGIVILHGTDTLTDTGERLHRDLAPLEHAVVLTGAMRPFEMKRSDALQNLTEALFAARGLPPGIYCVAHGRALQFPGVAKNRERGTFVAAREAAASLPA